MSERAEKEILSHDDVLALLSSKAAAGSVSAMVALERALRYRRKESVNVVDDELEHPGGRSRQGQAGPVGLTKTPN